MNEQSGSSNNCGGGYRPHMGGFLPFVIPLAIGFMLGTRKAMMHRAMSGGNHWETGVPPFFAEMHRRAHAAEAKGEESRPENSAAA